ncbi:MAG: DNA (cytosine-5-)-methyltransferase [Selenomonadaceae bacterium]|nr:DNA (cytosine-5-)-methyltransferase [Selenomonadaceae bacterium]
MPIFHLGELFCGPGGLGWGAANAAVPGRPDLGIVHAWANDFDAPTCATYRRNLAPDDPDSVICEDVHKLDIEHDPRIQAHPFDAFAFGFPCNDFSQVGEQKGFDGIYGPLYTYGIRVLRHYQPRWFLAENVSGLSSANQGKAFKKILADMQAAGYRIYPHLYKFEEYGIPQARHRIIIIGIRADERGADGEPLAFCPPAPTTPQPEQYKTCREAIEVPPVTAELANTEMPKMTKRVQERLAYIGPGENAFNAPKLNEHPELQLKVKGAKISQIYRRLDPDKPSYTVTGSGGGGTHIYHWSEPRALMNRERARLQTFPDTFVFEGPKESVRRQIGMAVPCEGARQIFEAVLKTFGGVPYEHVDCNINPAKI